MSENNISTRAWQRCSALGLSNIDFTELTTYLTIQTLECLPQDKSWLIPLCIIRNDRLCKMRFMYQSLDDFVELIHNSTMDEIRGIFTQSATSVGPWMGLLIEESGLESMDEIMYKDWNMEKPVIGLSGWTLRRRARNYLIAAATSNSIRILYERNMVGPVSILKLDEYADSNLHELLSRVWHEFNNSRSSSNMGI